MSVAEKLTPSDVRTYFRVTQPDWNLNRKQIHVPCPLHNGVRDSFSLDTETGRWMCHSQCGGGDIVEYERRTRGLGNDSKSTAEAIKGVEEILGTTFTDVKPRQATTPKRAPMEIEKTYDYLDESGKFLFQVVRLKGKDFRQRQRRPDGSWQWNLQGARRVPYRLPELRSATGAVFFVEGEKDADRLRSMGLTATTSPEGAGKWRDEYAEYFQGKKVYVMPDMDEAKPQGTKYPGQQHAAQVMKALLKTARQVLLIEVPGAKDVSEWLDQHATGDFGLLANIARTMDEQAVKDYTERWANEPVREPELAPLPEEPPEETPEPETPTDPKGRHPNAIAQDIMTGHSFLTWGKESVWEYDGSAWRPVSPETIHRYALEAESKWITKRARRSEIVSYILTACRREKINWRNIAEYEVPLANGVLDLRTSELRPHRQEDYLESVMPIAFSPGSKCPFLEEVLRSYWGEDEDYELKVRAFQEFAGYVLMAHAKYKKCLILFGDPDTGKSQLLNLLRALVGEPNCSAVTVKDMGDPRKLAPIKGKFLNGLSELPQSAMIEDGGFKSLISTGDAIQIDQKWEVAETYVPFAKHVIVTNTLPRVNDLTDATFNRMLILHFQHPIPKEKQDTHLMEKLLAEAPGILNWALAGAKRLYENEGQFTEIGESKHLLEKYKRQNNGINDFLHLHCRASEGNTIDIDTVRQRYNAWKNERLSMTAIRRMLTSALGKEALDDWTLFDYAFKS